MLFGKKSHNQKIEDAPLVPTQKINENYRTFLEVLHKNGFSYDHLVDNGTELVQETGGLYLTLFPAKSDDGRKTSVVSTRLYSPKTIPVFFDIADVLNEVYKSKEFKFETNVSGVGLEKYPDDSWHEMKIYVPSKNAEKTTQYHYLNETVDILLKGENLLKNYIKNAKLSSEKNRSENENIIKGMEQLHKELVDKTGYVGRLEKLSGELMDEKPDAHYEDEFLEIDVEDENGYLSIKTKIKPKLPIDFPRLRNMIDWEMSVNKIRIQNLVAKFVDDNNSEAKLEYENFRHPGAQEESSTSISIGIEGEDIEASVGNVYKAYELVKNDLVVYPHV